MGLSPGAPRGERARRTSPGEGGEGQVGPVLWPGRLRMRDFLRTDSLIEAGSEENFAKRCGEGSELGGRLLGLSPHAGKLMTRPE